MMTSDEGAWSLEPAGGGLARLRSGRLSGRVEVSRPQFGVHDLRIDAAGLAGQMLSVSWAADRADWPMPLADAYIRGHDLVAAYRRTPDFPFDPQIYWRGESSSSQEDALGSLSLVVSIQTDSLETHPGVHVSTRLAAKELIPMPTSSSKTSDGEPTAFCLLWRLDDGDVSYAEIVPEGDYRDLSVECDSEGLFTAHWELFGEFLEKGVIRRARIHSFFLPRKRDEELAADACRAILQRPLPLTV